MNVTDSKIKCVLQYVDTWAAPEDKQAVRDSTCTHQHTETAVGAGNRCIILMSQIPWAALLPILSFSLKVSNKAKYGPSCLSSFHIWELIYSLEFNYNPQINTSSAFLVIHRKDFSCLGACFCVRSNKEDALRSYSSAYTEMEMVGGSAVQDTTALWPWDSLNPSSGICSWGGLRQVT